RGESAAPRPRPAARAKPAPRAPRSIDPATLRLAVLGGIAVLIVAGFGYWFWHETSGAGGGANLPMVPMPLSDAPGAAPAPAPLLVAPEEPAVAEAAQEAIHAQEQSPREQAAQATQAAQAAAQPPAPAAAAPPPQLLAPLAAVDSGEIKVQRGDSAPRLNAALESAYQAFTAGDSEAARRQYDAVLRQEANNRDALLGLAAIAVRERQGAQAAGHYLRLLELDPNDGEALAGLIALRQGDAVQGESRLKAILQRSPDAGPVLFALGNLYAKQSRWSDAQQLFFRAYSATPGNPDYAFNLAVGLDRLNQGKLALGYYQRALALAQNTPGAFDRGAVRRRMHELSQADAAPPVPTN
ncbi:tetratricopeptide repeat protein, partial [Janthinobacterium sp.]|uniref:tetratricopeptide repeat protein n=1 Tax=Janthinobacterium sp. TaxID=1871054 RepID=UPI00293D26CF